MPGSRRTALLAFGWLLTAAAVGFVAAWLLRPAAEVRYLPAGGTREPAPTPDVETATRASAPSRPEAIAEAARPAEPRRAAAPVGSSAGATADSPALLVTVVRADGSPAQGGSVYALGAGESGADEAEEVCHCDYEYGERGPVRLPLPRPGVYDVGYRSDLHAFATDVRVGPGETVPLTLRVPGDRPVRAEITGAWPPEGAPKSWARLVLRPADERGRRNFPGRGERPRLRAHVAILTDDRAGESEPLLTNEAWRVGAEIVERLPRGHGEIEGESADFDWVTSFRHELVPDREIVRTGETVRLRVRSWPVVRFRVDGTGLDAGDGHVALDFHAGGAAQRGWLSLPRGLKRRRVIRWFRSEGGEYRLRWSGKGIAAGEVSGTLPAPGRFADVDIILRPDPHGTPDAEPAAATVAAEPAPSGPEPLEVSHEGLPPGSDAARIAVGLLTGDGGGVEALADHAEYTESDGNRVYSLDGDWRRASAIRFVSGTDRASDPVTPPSSGPLHVVFRPAGLLCAVPDRVLPEGFGRLTVRLADGAPLPVHDGDQGDAVAVSAGTLLGPLPEGTYTFKVRLGGVSLPDATATVRAGGVEVLRISTR